MEINAAIMDTLEGRSEPILLIEAPPRHGKSELVSKYLPSWYLCKHPDKKVILCGYGDTFAHEWGGRSRDIVSEFGPRYFGISLAAKSRAEKHWRIEGHQGEMLASGLHGTLTGYGAHLFIIDDHTKSYVEALSETWRNRQWDWWQSTGRTRLEPGGKLVVIATRWNPDDLSGRLLRDAQEHGLEVRQMRLPAIAEEDDLLGREPGEALWPERYDVAFFEKFKATEDPYWWNAVYQQRPSVHGRAEWPESYFEDIWAHRWPDQFESSVIAVDISKGKSAKAGDYSAIVFAGTSGGRIWVDADIDRRPVPKIVSDTLWHYHEWDADHVVFETNGFQELVVPMWHHQCSVLGIGAIPIIPVENREKKELRISRIGPYLAPLNHLLRFRETSGGRFLVRQLAEFPNAEHDDGPDALEMALRILSGMVRESVPFEDLQPVRI